MEIKFPNKQMVPTLPALRNFEIIARHNGLGGGAGFFTAGQGAGGPHI